MHNAEIAGLGARCPGGRRDACPTTFLAGSCILISEVAEEEMGQRL